MSVSARRVDGVAAESLLRVDGVRVVDEDVERNTERNRVDADYTRRDERDGARREERTDTARQKTTQAWAGKSSDISYYLNSHHVDFHEWCCSGKARPERVIALSSTGVAQAARKALRGHDHAERPVAHASHERPRPRLIHVVVGRAEGRRPQPTEVVLHGSHRGEVTVDQAHRGYTVCTDSGDTAA